MHYPKKFKDTLLERLDAGADLLAEASGDGGRVSGHDPCDPVK